MSEQGKTVDWDRVRDASGDLCLAASNLSVRMSHTRPTEAPLAVEAERDQKIAEVLRLSDELREALAPCEAGEEQPSVVEMLKKAYEAAPKVMVNVVDEATTYVATTDDVDNTVGPLLARLDRLFKRVDSLAERVDSLG